jgi:hypothetical protein
MIDLTKLITAAQKAQIAAAVAAGVVARQKDGADATVAKAYPRLKALTGMSPAQVQTWGAANLGTDAQKQEAIITLAIGFSILARRL